MPNTPDPGVPGSPDEEKKPWLGIHQVTALWPVREDYVGQVARQAKVRRYHEPGESYGTYGQGQGRDYYHPGDVRQTATAIAEGRLDIPSLWRTDTPDGRRAVYWSRFRLRLTITIILIWLFGSLAVMAWYLVPIFFDAMSDL